MTRTLPFAALALTLLAGAALAGAKPNTPIAMPKVQARMKAVVDKSSNDLFNTAGAADPANGADQQLPDAAGWVRVKADADRLKGVAEWLQDPKNGKATEAAWRKAAKSMGALSAAASRAAAAHDASGLAKAANDLSDTCTACHSVYKKQS